MRDSVAARKVDIKLTGVAGSGKTIIMHIIGKALTDAGFNVTATDEYAKHRTGDFLPGQIQDPDNRRVHITTAYPK